MRGDEQILQALLRADFQSFLHKVVKTLHPGHPFLSNWHIDHLTYRLARLENGEATRLLVSMPPRYLKSIVLSVAWPAWLLGQDPTVKIICVSFSADLSEKHTRDFRRIVTSTWYRKVFAGMRISRQKDSATEIETTKNGFRYSTSLFGAITGRGGDYIIIDDPIKPEGAASDSERERVNRWFESTLFTRLDNKAKGRMVTVMQRLHEDDLIGHLIAKGDWECVSLPAIATETASYALTRGGVYTRNSGEALHPEYESLETLEEIREMIGSRVFESQYQQSPVPAEGNMFHREWLRYYTTTLAPEMFQQIVQSWDTAMTASENADYSVGTTWGITGNNSYHLLDVERGRYEFPALLHLIKDYAVRHRANLVLIEEANTGLALLQSLRHSGGLSVTGYIPKLPKETRAYRASATVQGGRVFLPNDAPWLGAFEREILAFPNGRHDDQVDSMVQFLLWAADHHVPLAMIESIPKLNYWSSGGSIASGWIF